MTFFNFDTCNLINFRLGVLFWCKFIRNIEWKTPQIINPAAVCVCVCATILIISKHQPKEQNEWNEGKKGIEREHFPEWQECALNIEHTPHMDALCICRTFWYMLGTSKWNIYLTKCGSRRRIFMLKLFFRLPQIIHGFNSLQFSLHISFFLSVAKSNSKKHDMNINIYSSGTGYWCQFETMMVVYRFKIIYTVHCITPHRPNV